MIQIVVAETEQRIGELGGLVVRDPATESCEINEEFSISVVLARCHTTEAGDHRWKVRFDTSLCPDITVAVRLDLANRAALDYYLLPGLDFGRERICLAESTPSNSIAIGLKGWTTSMAWRSASVFGEPHET